MGEKKVDVIRFVKNWTLPIAMVVGALSYFIYAGIPALNPTHAFVGEFISYAQPILIFCMLFLTFCKVKPSDLKLRKWFLWLALIQCLGFTLLGGLLVLFPDNLFRLVIQGAMLSLICPTATACAVVTMRLGGDAALVTTYTILINLAVALIVPAVVPIVHPQEGLTFLPAFFTILRKIFPMLICPLITAWLIRWIWPAAHRFFLSLKDLAFYLWAVALALAIGVTCKAIMHTDGSIWDILGILLASLVCCLGQFAAGWALGRKDGHRTEGGQALGQKNTVFIIWLGYTFLDPISSTAGGFYSIWHNLMNTWELYKKRKADEALVRQQ